MKWTYLGGYYSIYYKSASPRRIKGKRKKEVKRKGGRREGKLRKRRRREQ